MKARVAKKITKNSEILNYHKAQVTKAETIMRREGKKAKKAAAK